MQEIAFYIANTEKYNPILKREVKKHLSVSGFLNRTLINASKIDRYSVFMTPDRLGHLLPRFGKP